MQVLRECSRATLWFCSRRQVEETGQSMLRSQPPTSLTPGRGKTSLRRVLRSVWAPTRPHLPFTLTLPADGVPCFPLQGGIMLEQRSLTDPMVTVSSPLVREGCNYKMIVKGKSFRWALYHIIPGTQPGQVLKVRCSREHHSTSETLWIVLLAE